MHKAPTVHICDLKLNLVLLFNLGRLLGNTEHQQLFASIIRKWNCQ